MACLAAVSDLATHASARTEATAVAATLDAPVPTSFGGGMPAAAAHAPAVVPGRWIWRIAWAALFAVPTVVVITAALLTPDPAGHGTHTQLGLPPCGFLVVTGFPCPGCGLTTAFTNMVRFNVVGAAHANPFGIPLFLTTVSMIPIALFGTIRGTHVMDTLERFQADKIAILLATTSVTVWVVRVATMLLAG